MRNRTFYSFFTCRQVKECSEFVVVVVLLLETRIVILLGCVCVCVTRPTNKALSLSLKLIFFSWSARSLNRVDLFLFVFIRMPPEVLNGDEIRSFVFGLKSVSAAVWEWHHPLGEVGGGQWVTSVATLAMIVIVEVLVVVVGGVT